MLRHLTDTEKTILTDGITLNASLFQNIVGFLNSNDRGHIGVAFNMIDEQHFDFVFFR